MYHTYVVLLPGFPPPYVYSIVLYHAVARSLPVIFFLIAESEMERRRRNRLLFFLSIWHLDNRDHVLQDSRTRRQFRVTAPSFWDSSPPGCAPNEPADPSSFSCTRICFAGLRHIRQHQNGYTRQGVLRNLRAVVIQFSAVEAHMPRPNLDRIGFC